MVASVVEPLAERQPATICPKVVRLHPDSCGGDICTANVAAAKRCFALPGFSYQQVKGHSSCRFSVK
jgi:hypothetical protein